MLWRWRERRVSADGFEIHWRTNYLGTFHLTRLLLPMLLESGRRSRDARVINVSSHQHDKGRNDRLFAPPDRLDSWTAYGQSKLALIHHASSCSAATPRTATSDRPPCTLVPRTRT